MVPGPKDSKKKAFDSKSVLVTDVVHSEMPCPFKEFRDTELTPEYWGMGTLPMQDHFPSSRQSVKASTLKATESSMKASSKAPKGALAAMSDEWEDSQTQPLPGSARSVLNRWVKAEELALARWNVEVIIADENCVKMSPMEMQMTHAQVLHRSSFCREVFSACYILENMENFVVEHQWENFVCSVGDGWFAKYHIYSPGLKPGGGPQHKPTLAKNGCYLVRLFYLGAWRCVWVNDQVPVDSTDAPLLPFCPLFPVAPPKPVTGKAPVVPQVKYVHLWPLLLCKALLKLAAPKLGDYYTDDASPADEELEGFNILHALTGALEVSYLKEGVDKTWQFLQEKVRIFSWDVEEPSLRAASQMKNAKATAKKPTTSKVAATTAAKSKTQNSLSMLVLQDSKCYPPYYVPGITPSHEMRVYISMIRDIPLKKPLPEPEVSLWKKYRWVDWAKAHGLYKDYECPRTKFIRISGLLMLSYAPHLLDVMSSESISSKLREHIPGKDEKKNTKQTPQDKDKKNASTMLKLMREELKDWAVYELAYTVTKTLSVLYFPNLHEITSAGSEPPLRITKLPWNPTIDMLAPLYSPFYLQVDSADAFDIKICLSTMNPRVLANCNVPLKEYFEPAYLYLEEFNWFEDDVFSEPTTFIKTRGHGSVQAKFSPGRHICRLWIHSRIQWHVMVLSEEHVVLGAKDVLMEEAGVECSWSQKFLAPISAAFQTWIKIHRPYSLIMVSDRDFFKSYQPNLEWDPDVIYTPKAWLHWMFRKAVQSTLYKKLSELEYSMACKLLRYVFMDPEFGVIKKTPIQRLEIVPDLCDCVDEEIHEDVSLIEEIKKVKSEEIKIKKEKAKETKSKTDKLPEPRLTKLKLDKLPEPRLKEEKLKEEGLKEEKLSNDKLIEIQSTTGAHERALMQIALVISPTILAKTAVCDFADEEFSCAILGDIKKQIIDRYRAVIVLQSHARGYLARKCLRTPVQATPEALKIINEAAFGSVQTVSDLMNEFFLLFPEVKPAFTLSKALVGTISVQKYTGISTVHYGSQWVPFFQNTFYCHEAVRVQFDIKSDFNFSLVEAYNNDNEQIMPKIYNVPRCYDFFPNEKGFTIIGYGALKKPCESERDGHWWLTILCSIQKAFHLCDNDLFCNELVLISAHDLFIQESFIPNRRNILGGIRLSVYTDEVVSFRAHTSCPDLEIEAVVKTIPTIGDVQEVRLKGKGEINWSFMKISGRKGKIIQVRQGFNSMINLKANSADVSSSRSTKTPKTRSSMSSKRLSASKTTVGEPEMKNYLIEIIAPKGWPLTFEQWEKVEDERHRFEAMILQAAHHSPAKTAKDKKGAKDHDKKADYPDTDVDFGHKPPPGAAFTTLQCSYNPLFGAVASRDDSREKAFIQAVKSWSDEPGRNDRGIILREEFLDAFKASDALISSVSDFGAEYHCEEDDKDDKGLPILEPSNKKHPGTKNSLASLVEKNAEEQHEEILYYLTRPEQFNDKFRSFDFLEDCTNDIESENEMILTDEMMDEGKMLRHDYIMKGTERMKELQNYNNDYMLKRQRRRCKLTDKLYVDANWNKEILGGFEVRDQAIAEETLRITQSLTRKKEAAAAAVAATKGSATRKK